MKNVYLEVKDADYTSSAESSLTIINVAPNVVIDSIVLNVIPIDSTVDALASFTDPGILDTHLALWDWGDTETLSGTVSESGGSGTVIDSHTYTSTGVYTVTRTVTDSDGDSGVANYQYVIVYDPSEGFVTGGGWIDSPAGAYWENGEPTDLEGKATFGLVSKYKKGATVPTGNTEFVFQAGDLNFHSNSYDWLVIAGKTLAKFKGVGAINGEGEYKFMITAIDAEIDSFRIKIWTEDEFGFENVVYDNHFDAIEGSDPTTDLGGGSIVIHTVKAKK